MKQISIDGGILNDVIHEAKNVLLTEKLKPSTFLIQRIKRTNQYSFSIKADHMLAENSKEVNAFISNLNNFVDKYFRPTVAAYYDLPDVREVEINSTVSDYKLILEDSERSVYFETSTTDTSVLVKRLQINLNNISSIQSSRQQLSSFNEFELVYSKDSYRRMKFIDRFASVVDPKIEYAINDLVVFFKCINNFTQLPSRPTFLLSMRFSLETDSMLNPIGGKYMNYLDLEYSPSSGFRESMTKYLDTNLESVLNKLSCHLNSIDFKKKKIQRNQSVTDSKFRVQANFLMGHSESAHGLNFAVNCTNTLLTDADLTSLESVSIALTPDEASGDSNTHVLNSLKLPPIHKPSTVVHIKDLNLVG